MHPDKGPLAFGKNSPTSFVCHGFISVCLIADLICIERWSYGRYPMPISRYGEGYV